MPSFTFWRMSDSETGLSCFTARFGVLKFTWDGSISPRADKIYSSTPIHTGREPRNATLTDVHSGSTVIVRPEATCTTVKVEMVVSVPFLYHTTLRAGSASRNSGNMDENVSSFL